jgi:DNA-binding MarR family transcriptional regulator
LPTYQGAMNYIELDVAVSEFHLNAIHNGMMPSKLISFNNGTPSEEEQRTIERRMRDKFAGEANAGKFIINFNNDPAKAPTVLDLSASDLDKQFDLLNKTIQQEIFSGHRITSASLFGIATEGALGARNEMRTAYEIFQNTYVNGKQQFIERWFGYILPLFGINDEFLNAQQDIVNSIKSLPQEIAAKVIENMSADELRGLVGLNSLVQQVQTREQFTAEDDKRAIEVFSKYGQDEDKFVVIKEMPMRFDAQGNELHDENFAGIDIIITQVQSSVLDLIRKNPLINIEDIAFALKVDKDVVRSTIASLEANKLISSTEIDDNGQRVVKREITSEGRAQRNARRPLADVKIFYQYQVTPGLGAPVIPTTREFC